MTSKGLSPLSVSAPLVGNMTMIQNRVRGLVQVFGRIVKKVSVILGIIGGGHALYQIYLANNEQSTEKSEILVLKRSIFNQ